MSRLLLLSNSRCFGQDYLEHARVEILEFLGGIRRLAFVPFALHDHVAYVERVREGLSSAGIDVDAVSADASGRERIEQAQAVYVGGGNTFRLLRELRRSGLLAVLRQRALAGMPYLGASAGTNVAGPTIRTTNDMPIVEPGSFDALGLVPFQINPHYQDPDPASRHMGETREARVREFLEESATPVLGIREGTWVRVENGSARLGGAAGGARLFRRGSEPQEFAPGAHLDSLLSGG